jgi:hypothetical protein
VGSSHDERPDVSRSRMYWLPPNSFGNGIDAEAWAELADLSETEVAGVMFAFAEARIGANVALPRATVRHEHSRYRLWVDTRQYRRAEDLLMEVLAELRHRRPPNPG